MDYSQLIASVPPRSGATQEWVFQVLRDNIINGKLQGGQQLKQDEISAGLKVSHIPVREALRQLEMQGLVTISPNRGASVTILSREALEDMMEIRASISCSLVRRAVPLMEKTDFDELDAILRQQEQTTDIVESEKLNYRFHELLTAKANNTVADLLIEIIHANADRYLRYNFYGIADEHDASIQGHRDILSACRERDAEKAASLLQTHILSARRMIPEEL